MGADDTTERAPISYRALQCWARMAAAVIYRRVEVTAEPNVPTDRPTILAANHSNALADVAVIVAKMPRFPHFLAAASWWKHRHARVLFRLGGVLPVHRASDGSGTIHNASTFEACQAALALGEHLAIFPEGVMGPGHALLPIKTGAARIGLSAAADGEVRGVVIVPLGLVYEDRGRFRSSAEVHFGEPIEMDRWVDRYRDDPADAVRRVTDLLSDRLAAVTVNGGSNELATLISRSATMVLADSAGSAGEQVSTARRNALRRRLAAALDTANGEDDGGDVGPLAAAVAAHLLDLARLGFDDSQSLDVARGSIRARRLTGLVLWSPVAALGALVNAPAVVVVGLLSPLVRLDGWQATTKGVGGTFMLPVTWTTGIVLGSRRFGLRRAAVVTVAGAASGLATLSWLDRVKEVQRASAIAAARRTRPKEVAQAQRSRAEVARQVEALVGAGGSVPSVVKTRRSVWEG